MSKTLNVSISPHIRSRETTTTIMADVIIALLPSVAVGIYVFGVKALIVTLLCVISCVASEYIYEKLLKKPVTVGDLSAVVTGLILAVNLYSTAPWWLPVLGGAFAIIVVKMLYGGIGQNFMNPALAARCFLLLSFSRIMTDYPQIDGVSGATPLTLAKNEGIYTPITDLLLGTHSGTIGETSAIAIAIGFAYLCIKGIIKPREPLSVIISTGVFVTFFSVIQGTPITLDYLAVHMLGGGLLLGAVFMASDYATTPVTPWGQIMFGCCVGFITALIRCVGGGTEGVSYAIIISNLLTPFIDRLTAPRPFGVKKERKERVAK